jgi:hypothetical protein
MADVASSFVPFDLDTGGGTQYIVGMSPRGESSGGSLPLYNAPVALGDNTTNPTVGGIAVFPLVFDGTNWDRMLGDQTDGLLVNLGTNNDVVTELPAAAAMTDTLANPTAPAVASHLVGFDRVNTDWTRIDGLVDGQVVNAAGAGLLQFGTDGSNYQAISVDAAGQLQVDIVTMPAVDTELPAAAAMTDALANPTTPAIASHLVGWDRVNSDWTRIAGIVDGEVVGALNAGFLQIGTDGTNYQAILTDATGALQVDVLSGGGSPPAPTDPVNDSQTSVAVAVATPTDIDGLDDDNRKLAWIDIWASVAWKGEVFTVDNAVESSRKGVTGGPAHTAVQYVPQHEDFIQVGATAGVDAFRLKVTNLDDNLPADFHVVFHYKD